MSRIRVSKGFTLIELLVAITILAVISTVGLTTYLHAQVVGRDGHRKQDIRSIAIAIGLYYQTFGHYPCTGGAGNFENSTVHLPNWIYSGCFGGPPDVLVPRFINSLPIDPLNTSPNIYRYESLVGCNLTTDGGGFVLSAVLENSADADAIGAGTHHLCDGTNLDSGAWGPSAFIVSND